MAASTARTIQAAAGAKFSPSTSCKKSRPARSRDRGHERPRLSRSGSMSARTYLTVLTVAATLALAGPDAYQSMSAIAAARALSNAGAPSVSAAASGQTGQHLATTLDDQTELSLTVYNSDIALVRDVRNLQLVR